MEKIAKFEKVSLNQFEKDYLNAFPELTIKNIELRPNETIKVPTGIRAKINNGWVLTIYPRSGLGFKYRLQLNNTVGIIDSDYYGSSNEGHIYIKITNDTNENRIISIKEGEGFAQGIFFNFGITVDDEVSEIRDGGFGSTTK